MHSAWLAPGFFVYGSTLQGLQLIEAILGNDGKLHFTLSVVYQYLSYQDGLWVIAQRNFPLVAQNKFQAYMDAKNNLCR